MQKIKIATIYKGCIDDFLGCIAGDTSIFGFAENDDHDFDCYMWVTDEVANSIYSKIEKSV